MLEYDLNGFKGEFKGRVGEVTGVAIDGWLRGREVAVASPGCLYANMTLQFVDLTERVNQARRSVRLHQRGETGCDGEVVGGAKRNHYDSVAFGGWSIDLHPADGVYSPKNGCNQWHSKGIYPIPYRCYVSYDIDNLFIGGRQISASHVAFGSSRVMCTSAHGGQAIGMAAALCIKENKNPADYIDATSIKDLQRALIATGQYIPQLKLNGFGGLAANAIIQVSSELALAELKENGSFFK